MSRVPWPAFQRRQPQSHLLVAILDADFAADMQAAQALLQRLVRKQKPISDYATAMVRDAGRPEVYIAFEDETDARKLAAAVEAQAASSYPGWASQREFQLDGEMVATLAGSVPPPQTRRKEPSANDTPLGRRIRRGPRTPIRHDEE
jgi:hypothetical protein